MSTSSPSCNPLAIQPYRRYSATPSNGSSKTSVDLSYRGFEVTVSTESIAWTNVSGTADATAAAAAEEDHRVFEIMLTPANAALHWYIKDLAHVRIELDAPKTAEEDEVVKKLELRVKEERRRRVVG